jgi:hypothetical protein
MWTKTSPAVLLLAVRAVVGCSSRRHTEVVPPDALVTKPPPGASLVIFVRPDGLGASRLMLYAGPSDPAFLWDDAYYVGTIMDDQHVAYVTKPGLHLFSVTSEAADFLEAELLPDRTYYVMVGRRFGGLRERFSLIPALDPKSLADVKEAIGRTSQIRQNDRSAAWERGKRETHARMRRKYLPMWEVREDRVLVPGTAGE